MGIRIIASIPIVMMSIVLSLVLLLSLLVCFYYTIFIVIVNPNH